MNYTLSEKSVEKLRRTVAAVEHLPAGRMKLNSPHRPITAEESATAYRSYFSLVNGSTSDEAGNVTFRVLVVDGATYNSENGTSGPSICKVNGQVFKVPFWQSEALTADTWVALKFSAAVAASGSIPAAAAKVELVARSSPPPSDGYAECYKIIGRAIFLNGSMKIQQDFFAGVAEITHYAYC